MLKISINLTEIQLITNKKNFNLLFNFEKKEREKKKEDVYKYDYSAKKE